MTQYLKPMCEDCVHYTPETIEWDDEMGLPNWQEVPKCKAFPGGIPEDIYPGGYNHRKPYPGDGGIRFQKKKDL